VAKILYDRDGTGERLKTYAENLLKEKPEALDEEKIGHLRFDATDSIRAAEVLYKNDPATASLLVHKKASDLANVYFDTQQLWHPAPKQQLQSIKELNEDLGKLFADFYITLDFEQKVIILKKVVGEILGEKSSDIVQ
jgi:hypothetical protein